MDDTLTVVVPAFNERKSLEANLDGWLEICAQHGWNLVVVDDGSTDGTEQVLRVHARDPRFLALRHRTNRGYGTALKTGLLRVTTSLAVTVDADGQHRLEDIALLVEAMRSTRADMVVGARLINDTSGAYRRLGKSILRLIARLLFRTRIRDLNSGFKLYKTALVQRLLPWCPGSMAFSDIITLLHLDLDMHVVEIPIRTQPRQGGRSTINTMTAVDTLVEIVNVVMALRPLKLLIPVAIMLVALGGGWAIPFLLAGKGMSGAAMLIILTGLLTALLGLLAEQMAASRRSRMPVADADEIAPA